MASGARDRRRNRIRAPFGDEDIPIVFAGITSSRDFNRRMSLLRRTAFVYDDRMLTHKNNWRVNCSENPDRLTTILDRCSNCDLLSRCLRISAEPAPDNILLGVHDREYLNQISDTAMKMDDEQRLNLCKSFDSVYLNEHSDLAARIAVGSVIQAVDSVHRNDARNAFCLVRPPGHHAMEKEACGFCIFNNVAVAAQYALDQLEYNRILIIDWDVHHGNGTQYMFYDNSRVLYISIHRYNHQRFWPKLRESCYEFVGQGRGRGFNINVALNEENLSDADYLAIFHRLVLPVAYEYDPELVLVSAGYDCAYGCPSGQFRLSPSVFAHFTHKLMCLAQGKVIVVLEGGDFLNSLAESVAHTLSTLLGDPVPSLEPLEKVHPSVIRTISDCVSVHRHRWRSLHLFQVADFVATPELSRLPVQTWSDVKAPSLDFKESVHTPEALKEINQRLTYLKRTHKVARNADLPRTCIVYDSRMENHKNEDDRSHPETPNRIRRSYELLEEYGLARRCKRVEARHATRAEILAVHTENYLDRMAATARLDQSLLSVIADDDDSIFLNRHSYDCALLAAGSVLAVVDEVCTAKCQNGIALVRPPGHHAMPDRSMGFCIFNNVAVAARYAQQKYGIQRVAIVDWDVHHGNGTEEMFKNDPNVLFVSIHRYDEGRFFPSTTQGNATVCGQDEGLGRTVQVGWNGRHIRDGEYIAVFLHLILPVLYEFRPELILVSAGFDAARGDRLGGLGVSVECFAHLTQLLMTVAYLVPPSERTSHSTVKKSDPDQSVKENEDGAQFSGGIILTLEGGYNLSATAEAVCHSVASLLGDCCPRLAFGLAFSDKGCRSIQRTLVAHEKYWDAVKGYGPVRGSLTEDYPDIQKQVDKYLSPAFTGQLEADIHSRLEDLSLTDGISSILNSPVENQAQSSVLLPTSIPEQAAMGSTSLSVATAPVYPQVPCMTRQEAAGCVATDPSTHVSVTGGQIASASVGPSSAATLQGATTIQQLAEDLSLLRVTSPTTDLSDRSSLASEEPHLLHPPAITSTTSEVIGASGAIETTEPEAPVHGQLVASTTLQELAAASGVELQDIHAFFGLPSTHRLPPQLFAVTPLFWCPHLTDIENRTDWNPDFNQGCNRCEHYDENWVCLTCYTVCCGRYAQSHMLEHYSTVRHPIVLSCADLSSWCYECQSYVHNEILSDIKRIAHRAKFGEDIPGS